MLSLVNTAMAEFIRRLVASKHSDWVVNDELPSLQQFLAFAPQWLKPHGRIGIISFHSLEDRIIKHAFRDSQALQVITKKPIIAQADEIAENPRARSAKLRFAFRNPD